MVSDRRSPLLPDRFADTDAKELGRPDGAAPDGANLAVALYPAAT
jgi:hypothetical protein